MAQVNSFYNVQGGESAPVFIVGVMNRSGTNFLSDVLSLLPEFGLPQLAEDYFLEHSYLLAEYASRSRHRWKRLGDGADELALKCIGDGLVAYAKGTCVQPCERLVLKTPRAYGLQHFRTLFPNAQLLVLIRDGRDVVESAARSFPYGSYAHWMKQWRDGARMLQEFCTGDCVDGRDSWWKLIRYEDVVDNPRESIPAILKFLGVEVSRFDWAKFEAMPIRGSSSVASGDGGKVHWRPMKKPVGFKPVGRWSSWPRWRKLQFKRIAGRELVEWDYEQSVRW